MAALLSEKTGLLSIIENDANAMAYAEWRFGAGRDRLNVICMTLGTGLGGGLILDGKLFRGSQLGAGEIGQMIIEPHGAPGHYGNFGALEKYVLATGRSPSAPKKFIQRPALRARPKN